MTSDSEPVLTPGQMLAYRRASGHLPDFPTPHTVIFSPQKSLARYALRRYASKQVSGFLGELHLLKSLKGKVAISTNFGIGAPVIGALTDEFVALGVRQFILIGMAGGLQPDLMPGSLVVASGAMRGEGVSGHYLPANTQVASTPGFVQGVSWALDQQKHVHRIGLTWTTDAPYRELRGDVLRYQQQGVLAVEMEAAAMLAVAQSYQFSAVGMFSISDQLAGGERRVVKNLSVVQRGLEILFEAVLSYLIPERT